MKLGTNDIGSVYLGTNAVQKVYLGANEVWSSYAYLLDDYSGAAAAYSLRLLRSAYTGSAIGVRIDTTGQPEYNIGFVDGQLDVATLEGYCTGGLNAYVKTWYDQSGNARDATQSTAANKPQIVSSGSVIIKNAKPCVKFDGTNDDLINSTANTNVTLTLISVVNSENTSQDSTCIQISTAGNNVAFSQGFGGLGTSDAFGTRSRGASDIYKGKSNTGTNQLLAFQFGTMGVSNNLYVDGQLETASIGSRNTGSDTNFITIGSRGTFSYLNGNYAEIILYTSDQSSNRLGIETNINDYYSIY
jgi:hypothetical protein